MSSSVRIVSYLDELRRIVPTEQVDPQSAEGEGSWSVEPATRDELVDVIRWANERRGAVYTRRPRPSDADCCGRRPRIYLRGQRMKRMGDIDIVSGTVTVQSGIPMKELHAILEERGFTTGFPTRPWRQASLGAVLAAALDSHWGPRYGSMEEHVIGLGVVLPDGTIATSKSAPRRAVGPDLNRLFLGSRGRFGIVHEATVRIYPATSRVVLAYGAADLIEALATVEDILSEGVEPRAIEVLTPAPDRSWGRKRVGLTDERPLLLLVEPWGRECSQSVSMVDELVSTRLERLQPPVGWDVHEGLLPPPRSWAAPVVGVRWRELLALARDLGSNLPAGLWIPRLSRHGGWISVHADVKGKAADKVRVLLERHLPAQSGPWSELEATIKARLDPNDVLNPS